MKKKTIEGTEVFVRDGREREEVERGKNIINYLMINESSVFSVVDFL